MIVTDMTDRVVELKARPQRIISLVPSQTELLYDLGLDREVVGITKFCIHPVEWFRHKARVGGTKTIHPDIIDSLQPDLILANKEENTRDQVLALQAKYPVWVSEIKTIPDALKMISEVGDITGKAPEATLLASNIETGFSTLKKVTQPASVAYFIWRKPWMAAGGDTFISDMLEAAGFCNALGHQSRYPEISLADLAGMHLDFIFLSSEPYPFKETHIAEMQQAFPHSRVVLVDGEIFSWYGSRMQYAPAYLSRLIDDLQNTR